MSKDEQNQVEEEIQRRAYYGSLATGVKVRGRAVAATHFKEIEIPDFDDRPWEGPYDGDE